MSCLKNLFSKTPTLGKISNLKPLTALSIRHTSEEKFPVDSKMLRKLESLSKLSFPDDKKTIEFFRNNLEFLGKLDEVDTSGVEPMYSTMEDQELQMREDVPEIQCLEGALRNASRKEEDFFVVDRKSGLEGEIFE